MIQHDENSTMLEETRETSELDGMVCQVESKGFERHLGPWQGGDKGLATG